MNSCPYCGGEALTNGGHNHKPGCTYMYAGSITTPNYDADYWRARAGRAEAEVARLMEVLRKIAHANIHTPRPPVELKGVVMMARGALSAAAPQEPPQ